jgi:hypothetical protein
MSLALGFGAATAAGLYYYSTRRGGPLDDEDRPLLRDRTHSNVHAAPESLKEDLYFLFEGLRYVYSETIGSWRAADLVLGIRHFCLKDNAVHPTTDIAQLGTPYARGLSGPSLAQALAELAIIERVFRLCAGMRERRPDKQRLYFQNVCRVDVEGGDLIDQVFHAGVLKPSYVIIRDKPLGAITLIIRGTHSFKDLISSLTGAQKPHHLSDSNGVVLGHAHFGMLAAARWLKKTVQVQLKQALEDNPGFKLRIIGHSLGAGAAVILTMLLRESGPPFDDTTCIAIACPCCLTANLAKSCSSYVTSIINNTDVVPTICPANADRLREDISSSDWMKEWKANMRSSAVVQAVEKGITKVGSVTMTATSWTTNTLSACYSSTTSFRKRGHKRRNSDTDTGAIHDVDNNNEDGGDGTNNDDIDDTIGGGTTTTTTTTTTIDPPDIGDSYSRWGSISSSIAQVVTQSSLGRFTTGWSVSRQEQQDVTITAVHQQEEIREEEEDDEEDDDELREQQQLEDELQRQMSTSMNAVERAVHDAEEEEARLHIEDHIPTVIRPGQIYPGSSGGGGGNNNNNNSGGASSSLSRGTTTDNKQKSWKRQMHPAGRILHLVPATLVLGGEYGGGENSQQQARTTLQNVKDALREEREMVVDGERGGSHTYTSSKLYHDQQMILLDHVPNEAYCRIKLCRTVLSDHIIPEYLRSLESAVGLINEGKMEYR